MSLMGFDYAPLIEVIQVTKDTGGNYLYNEEPSLYKLLGSTPGIQEVWETMSFPQRCALTAEMHIALGVDPDAVIANGLVFGVLCSYIEQRDDWLVEVIDPRDNSHIYTDWLSLLRESGIMTNRKDVSGLQKFLTLIGELFDEDKLVDMTDPKFTSQGPATL